MKSKKILFHLNSLGRGGAERVVSTLANAFRARGAKVVVATEWTEEEEFALADDVKRIHVGLSDADRYRKRLGKYLTRIENLYACVKEERPDVVIAFARLALFRALMVCPALHIPVIISVRIDPKRSYTGFRNTLMIRTLLGKAAGAVFQTQEAADFFLPYLKCSHRVIWNPVADKYIGRAAPSQRSKRIVTAARLADFKNHPLLVKAFALVLREFPTYVLEIYGPDAGEGMDKKITDTAKALGIESKVRLMGASDALEEVLLDAALFVSSSDYEGMPNALMEAMALGLPVVSTDCPCGGPAALITDDINGRLVPVGDKEALARAMCDLLRDPEHAEMLGQRARELSRKADTAHIVDIWEDYILSVLDEKNR